ncbi:hypothetical protein K431DRAFT_304187 [Polychaeton citri CBS 116435]|uniref:Uncharacterized protein n=1 Tax=Polychaeton citri CBS 116435 TaxID=1314669 RepID=A0A9P4Q6M5_9PEZI|nr:hypothetical protein K431DRAFT_304187 [Polychaeton citri CBS 116435]
MATATARDGHGKRIKKRCISDSGISDQSGQRTELTLSGKEKFDKYGINSYSPTEIDFHASTDSNYDFEPRPMEPLPPMGPVTKDEFRKQFYKSSGYGSGITDTQQQRQGQQHQNALELGIYDKKFFDMLPKRKTKLNLADGKREVFWGLLAVEEFGHRLLIVYVVVCNLPWLIFAFILLYSLGHPADLQHAFTPIAISIALHGQLIDLLTKNLKS